MTKVLAQGVFDIIHPGHLHYLKQSKKLGDSLVVIIARDDNTEKKTCLNEQERLQIVNNLKPVDKAILGHKKDIYKGLEEVNPDVITLGYDQNFNKEELKQKAERLLEKEVRISRIDKKGNYSSTQICKQKIINTYDDLSKLEN